MTAYFDNLQERAAKLCDIARKIDAEEVDDAACGYTAFSEAIRALDTQAVFDCSVCVELPGCPEDIAQSVAECIYKHSNEGQPASRASKFWPVYETCWQHADGIARMVWDLHTIFHELAQRHIEGFSDNPKMPLCVLASRNEERRDRMTPKEQWSDVALLLAGEGESEGGAT